MHFLKMEGAGNDFVCILALEGEAPERPEQLASRICDRRRGVGGDGLVIVLPGELGDARMVVYNAGGTRADMCGNALRCVAALLADAGRDDAGRLRIETDQGVLEAVVVGREGRTARVRTEVGRPRLERAEIPMVGPPGRALDETLEVGSARLAISALKVGNPHCVVWTPDVETAPVAEIGPCLERHVRFPAGANAVFVQVEPAGGLRQRTWERGVGAETLACGTGAAAALVAGVLTGRCGRAARVRLRGGDLDCAWPADDAAVLVTGPATRVFEGTWTWR